MHPHPFPRRPLRIAYWCQFYWPEISAPSRRLANFSTAWQAHGHHVTIVTGMPNHPSGVIPQEYRGKLFSSEVKDGVRILRSWVHATPNRAGFGKLVGHLTFAITSLLFSGPRLGRTDVVIVSSPTFFTAYSAWITARMRGAKFVFEVRDLWPEAFVELGVLSRGVTFQTLRALARFLYQRADVVVVVTDSFADRIAQQGISRTKITTITNGADIEWFSRDVSAAAAQYRQNLRLEGRFIVAYIGAHGVSHGLMSVLQAAGLCHDPRVVFLLVGDGSVKGALEVYCHKHELANVKMLPAQPADSIREFYALADVCLVPLRDVPLFEAFIPSKMFEIMAAGRPIIGAVRGEARQILTMSGAALVIDPENPAQLLEAVTELASSPQRCAALGRAGRAFATANYSRQALGDLYLRLLEDAQA